jgi:hypothetical protein
MASLSFKAALELPRPKAQAQDTKALQKKAESAITKGVLRGGKYVQQDLRAALDLALESPSWSWPRETLRVNGSTAGTSRDIIDTGKLKSSLKFTEKNAQTKTGITITYTTPYAAMVHYGGAMQPYGNPRAATVIIPGRPWVTAVMTGTHGFEKFDANEAYRKGVFEAWNEAFPS